MYLRQLFENTILNCTSKRWNSYTRFNKIGTWSTSHYGIIYHHRHKKKNKTKSVSKRVRRDNGSRSWRKRRSCIKQESGSPHIKTARYCLSSRDNGWLRMYLDDFLDKRHWLLEFFLTKHRPIILLPGLMAPIAGHALLRLFAATTVIFASIIAAAFCCTVLGNFNKKMSPKTRVWLSFSCFCVRTRCWAAIRVFGDSRLRRYADRDVMNTRRWAGRETARPPPKTTDGGAARPKGWDLSVGFYLKPSRVYRAHGTSPHSGQKCNFRRTNIFCF